MKELGELNNYFNRVTSMKISALAAVLMLPTSFALANGQSLNQIGGEYKFLDCHAIVTTDGITVEQTLQVNFITNALKKPIAIKGTYWFNNSTEGVHGSAVLTGPISGRYLEETTGYSSVALKPGKLNINAEGDLQTETLYSVGYDASKTNGGYYSTVAGAGSRFVGVTGCKVSNLGLMAKIPLL